LSLDACGPLLLLLLLPLQVSALEDLWKAAPDAKVEDLDAAEVGRWGLGLF
jgi:hypothetical protein